MRTFLIGVLIFWGVTWGLIVQNDSQRERDTGRDVNDGRVEVIFWHAMSGPLGKVMDRLTDRYNASQKTYFIKSICMGNYDTLQKKLLASIVARQAPDIAQNYESVTRKFAKYGKIVCIDDLLASETEDIRADIVPVLLANNTFDSKLWSFPFNKSVPVLYYNKDLFKKAGLDPERPPKTWDDMLTYAEKLTQRDEQGRTTVYGFGTGK
ncbi:MAG TPA: extracellular solute-binding protein, partial [Candidatus Ozemobacteraceae bacterium]|nr:extracellular solute-binding protein [Candidatus Ozemobacteraceae bacterium]